MWNECIVSNFCSSKEKKLFIFIIVVKKVCRKLLAFSERCLFL